MPIIDGSNTIDDKNTCAAPCQLDWKPAARAPSSMTRNVRRYGRWHHRMAQPSRKIRQCPASSTLKWLMLTATAKSQPMNSRRLVARVCAPDRTGARAL